MPSGLEVSNSSRASGADNLADCFGQLPDRLILPRTDINDRLLFIVVQQPKAGVGQILNVEELSLRGPGPPDLNGRIFAPRCRNPAIVELSDQRRHHVGACEIELVAWAIQIGGHGRYEVAAVLPPVGVARHEP